MTFLRAAFFISATLLSVSIPEKRLQSNDHLQQPFVVALPDGAEHPHVIGVPACRARLALLALLW
jgi:hypothetical protein